LELQLMSDDLHVAESAGAYALGALSPEEAHEVEAHAASCPQCRAEIADLKRVVSLLPLAASSVEPSDDLKARILAATKGEDQADAILRRAVVTSQLHLPKRDFWHRPVPVWAGIAGWVGLAATCVVAGIFIGVTGEHSRMLSSLGSVPTASKLGAANRVVTETPNQVYPVTTEDLSNAVALIDQSQVWDFTVAKTGERMPYKVIQPPHVSHAMVLTDMPSAKQGMVYQVWLVRNGKVHRGGVVMPGRRSQAIIPMRVETGDVIAFTMEPMGGSAVPTGPFMMQQTL
jgi:anti-sigma-K factor RskA